MPSPPTPQNPRKAKVPLLPKPPTIPLDDWLPLPHVETSYSNLEIIRAMLGSKHIVSWPNNSWNISKDAGLEAASLWLAGLVDHVNAIRNMADGSTKTLDELAFDYRQMTEGY